jgi:hypothetical protein
VFGCYSIWLVRIVNLDYLKVGLKSNSVLKSELKLELEFSNFGGGGGGELLSRFWVN